MLVLHLPMFQCLVFKKILAETLRLSLASCVTLSYFTILSISFSVFSMGTIIALISEISLLNKILHMKYLAQYLVNDKNSINISYYYKKGNGFFDSSPF